MVKLSMPKPETRKLGQLKPFPAQAAFFNDLSDTELQALADDIREHGLKYPIEVMPAKNAAGLPANTIVSGHQRKRALVLNGESVAPVVIRKDLATASMDQVEKHFIQENTLRRQLEPLDRAFAALRLFEIERGRKRRDIATDELAETRDRVGAMVGISGRHLERYWRVLEAPLEVQAAVRGRQLPVALGARVAAMPKKIRAEIAARIAAGESPKVVVKQAVTSGQAGGGHTSAVSRLAKLLQGIAGLEKQLQQVPMAEFARHAGALQQTLGLLGRLLDDVQDLPEQDDCIDDQDVENGGEPFEDGEDFPEEAQHEGWPPDEVNTDPRQHAKRTSRHGA